MISPDAHTSLVWYYVPHMSTVCSNGQSINQNNTPYESCTSFFIKLTTLNDGNIDKDLLLTKFVPGYTCP